MNFREVIIPRIKEVIWLSLCSVKKKINLYDRKYSFEIFGYDFILDEEGTPWLIEVNTNPCIELSSPLLSQLIPRMIGNLFY